ncbi:MAG: ketopantoate reductase family protein [Burkholderiaceae bacterium]|nr:ketopantoate reductase family protein [Burkholderiaceae bacterium]
MRVCIVGCGAIGSLFGAHLARLPEVEVWAYDPDAAHVDAINRDGLRLTGLSDFVSPVRAYTDASQIPECEFGIVATKTLYTRRAIETTAGVFRDGAVCSVQNGVGNEEVIAEYVPRVILGTTFPAGHVTAPGVVNQDTGGKTWIGPFAPKPASMEEVKRLADAIDRSGMTCPAMPDARGALWTKLIFNSASNAMGALTRLPHGVACEQVWPVMLALAKEGIAVAEALEVELDGDPVALLEYGKKVAYLHKPSMLQDVLAHRATEVDALNGGIARIGREIGVPTPFNEAMATMIKGLEHSWTLKD